MRITIGRLGLVCRPMERRRASPKLYILMPFLVVVAMEISICGGEDVEALFVFGDSLVDTGNNNNLLTLVRASTPPYGADYHNGPGGGRFSNGPVITDFLAASLNLSSPPPHASAGDNLERGVNFASGGSGILDSTGDSTGQHIAMGQQVQNFKDVKQKLLKKLGSRRTEQLISKSIFYVTVGSNDYLVNYYSIPPSFLYALYSPEGFRSLLIYTLGNQLKGLYELGARKFAVAAIPNIGCIPYERELYKPKDGECVSFLNEDAVAYNDELLATLRQLQGQLPGFRFMLNNIYESALKIFHNPTPYGIVKVNEACCGGRYSLGVCFIGSKVCSNATQYYYFDGFHPTSLVHQLAAEQCISGTSPFVMPFNMRTLASLH